jgi:alanine dehydrogenase
MIIGCPSEIKVKEHRIAIVPASAKALIASGHQVLIQKNAGVGSGVDDAEYQSVGCQIIETAKEIWENSQMIVKVKEPLESELRFLRPGQILFTFLHLAAEPDLTKALLENNVTGIAYETIRVGSSLPLLKPSSEVAGRMSIQVGAWCLEKHQGGKGLLLGGVSGVSKANVVVLGGGVAGLNAAKVAVGMGAEVTILDVNLSRLEYLDDIFGGRIQTLYSNSHHISECVKKADLVIGAVLIAGAKAPKLLTRNMLSSMSRGSAIVDIAIDQGGCVETMHATTHDDPIFMVDGVVHYGVSNMPGAVARTSTFALTNATLPFIREIANLGVVHGCLKNPALALGLNTFKGKLTCQAVAKAHNLPFVEFQQLM